MKTSILLLALLACLPASLSGAPAAAPAAKAPAAAEGAPASAYVAPSGHKEVLSRFSSSDIVLPAGSGAKTAALQNLKTRRYLAVYVTATGCRTAKQLTPRVTELYKNSLPNGDIAFINVSRDPNKKIMEANMKESGFDFPAVLIGRNAKLNAFVEKFAQHHTTTFLIFDENDNVIGSTDKNGTLDIVQVFKAYWKQRGTPPAAAAPAGAGAKTAASSASADSAGAKGGITLTAASQIKVGDIFTLATSDVAAVNKLLGAAQEKLGPRNSAFGALESAIAKEKKAAAASQGHAAGQGRGGKRGGGAAANPEKSRTDAERERFEKANTPFAEAKDKALQAGAEKGKAVSFGDGKATLEAKNVYVLYSWTREVKVATGRPEVEEQGITLEPVPSNGQLRGVGGKTIIWRVLK